MSHATSSIARAVTNFIWEHPIYSYMIADFCVAVAYLAYNEYIRGPYPVVDFGCVESINEEKEYQAALTNAKIIIVEFYAEWCVPCARAVPEYAQLSSTYAPEGIKFYKIDTDKLSMLSQVKGVDSMPTFKIYKSGVCVFTVEGFDKGEIIRQLHVQASVDIEV